MDKVKNFYNKNQFIIENKKEITFQSYNSIIAIIEQDTGALVLFSDWNYSHTTLKHFYLFLRDYLNYLNPKYRGIALDILQSKNKKNKVEYFIDCDILQVIL